MAKPSENTSRDETAALAGAVAMRRKTANHGSLLTKKPKGEIFLPAKALKSHKMRKVSHPVAGQGRGLAADYSSNGYSGAPPP